MTPRAAPGDRLGEGVPRQGGAARNGQVGRLDGWRSRLADPAQLVGRAGDNLLFRHNGLHIELVIDRTATRSARTIRRASPTSCSNRR
jgi:hypothetical protein